MPKHQGVFDRMKPARILLDDPPEWREPGFHMVLPTAHRTHATLRTMPMYRLGDC